MGRGPLHLAEAGVVGRLGAFAPATSEVVETQSSFVTAMGRAFELHRAVSAVVGASVRSGKLPVVLAGNCNSAIGTVAGLLRTNSGGLGVVWFDGHGVCNTRKLSPGTSSTPWD